jgi:methyl-accepting chemotaxis protein
MHKFTRRIKRNKKNKTIRGDKILRGGYDSERKGVFDIVGDKIGDAASIILDKAEDIGLNALGLEKIDKTNETTVQATEKINETTEKVGDAVSGVVSDVKNVADKTSALLLDNVNEVLAAPIVSESVKEAGEQTAAITGKLAESFNNALDDPVVKKEVEQAIENAGEIGTVIVKAAEEPIKEAVKLSAEAGNNALAAAGSGAIKVGTEMLSAIPYFGAFIDLGKMINDGSRAASSVIEAGSEATENASDAVIKISENIKEGLKRLEEKKKAAEQISNRTTSSINQFENPLQNNIQSGGRRKTKRRLFKRKPKSKRVRFF